MRISYQLGAIIVVAIEVCIGSVRDGERRATMQPHNRRDRPPVDHSADEAAVASIVVRLESK